MCRWLVWGKIQYEVTANKRFSSSINWHSGICLEFNGMPMPVEHLMKVCPSELGGLWQIPTAAVVAKTENYRVL